MEIATVLLEVREVPAQQSERKGKGFVCTDASPFPRPLLELKAGAEPNMKDKSGWTPLHFAAMRGNSVMCELLLKWGANKQVLGGHQAASVLNIPPCSCDAQVSRDYLVR